MITQADWPPTTVDEAIELIANVRAAATPQAALDLARFVQELLDLDDELSCEGHESLDGAHMGEAVYCDGSCQVKR